MQNILHFTENAWSMMSLSDIAWHRLSIFRSVELQKRKIENAISLSMRKVSITSSCYLCEDEITFYCNLPKPETRQMGDMMRKVDEKFHDIFLIPFRQYFAFVTAPMHLSVDDGKWCATLMHILVLRRKTDVKLLFNPNE